MPIRTGAIAAAQIRPTRSRRWAVAMVAGLAWGVVGSALPGVAPRAAAASYVAPGFQVTTVFDGLNAPSAVAFAPNGNVFVAERGGVIKQFDSMADSTPSTVVNLSTAVHSVGDRGMLGLAIDPSYPARPYLYVTYMVDAPPNGGSTPFYNDDCPNDPVTQANDSCPAPGRLSRITVGTGAEQVLIGPGGADPNYWCHNAQAHALDHAEFGPDGALYVSSGEGAAARSTDYGQQSGNPNACNDPPGGAQPLSPPTTEGGSLRAQDLRTSGDPAGGSGAISRIDPDTGAAMPTNPLIGGDPTDDRIIAYGLRNPFRFTFRPGTSEIWVGDVGWNAWDEIDRIPNPTDPTVENFGWPCYEGAGTQSQWDALNVTICEQLYAQGGAATPPYWQYGRNQQSPDPARCANAGSAVSGVAFSEGAPFPAQYNGALFVADYVKSCIWVLPAGGNGLPSPANLETVVSGGIFPVDLEIGPDGRLYYVDIGLGTVERIDHFGGNQPPVARATATPSSGAVPLTVNFSGATSSDDQPTSQLTYAWDLDGGGTYEDATGVSASRTYPSPGPVRVGLQVTDADGLSSTTAVTVQAGNAPPTATILTPSATLRWASGDQVGFSGGGNDPEDGALGAAAVRWTINLYHCPTATECHPHPQGERNGVESGSFTAPQHEYPAYLEFILTVTDSAGLTDTETVRVDPRAVDLTFRTDPAGLEVFAGSQHGASPLTATAITGSSMSITAPAVQTIGGVTYDFASWSDGGAPSHDVMPGTTSATYTATYTPRPVGGTVLPFSDIAGSAFIADIAWVAAQGITLGCGNGQYCPKDNVTRAQMASFIGRALSLPAASADYFPDDAGSIHEADINRLAAAGISNGCGGGLYCPGAPVTRAQMASFLSRAHSLGATGQDYFSDDAGSFHEADINRLAAAGVTNGCGGGLYCPTQPVTREQMAAFLHRASGD